MEKFVFFSNLIEKINPIFYVNSITKTKIDDEVFLWIGIIEAKVDDENVLPKLKNVDFSDFERIPNEELKNLLVRESAVEPNVNFFSYNVWKKNKAKSSWKNIENMFIENGYFLKDIFFLSKKNFHPNFGMDLFFIMKIVPDLTGKRKGKWVATKTGIIESFSEFIKLNTKL